MLLQRSLPTSAWHHMWHEWALPCPAGGRPGVGSPRSRQHRDAAQRRPAGARLRRASTRSRRSATTSPRSFPPARRRRTQAEASARGSCSEVAERRAPRTNATVDQLLERYLDQFGGAPEHAGPVPHARPQPHLAVPRVTSRSASSTPRRWTRSTRELRRCRRRCSGRAERSTTGRRAARVRRAVPSAPVPAARPDDDPPHPLHPLRRLQAGRPVAMGRREPDRAGRAAAGAEAQPAAADGRRGRPDRQRGRGAIPTGARSSGSR